MTKSGNNDEIILKYKGLWFNFCYILINNIVLIKLIKMNIIILNIKYLTESVMKMVINLILAFFLIFGYAWSQVVVTQSFDGTSFPSAGWGSQKTGGSGSPGTWDRQTSGTNPTCSPRSGAAMARYNANNLAGGTEGIIISPSFDLTQRGGNNPTVSFWLYRDDAYSANSFEGVYVYINTSPSLTGASQLGFVTRYNLTTGWYQFTYNIPSGFNTQSNYLLFRGYSQAGNNIFIDDIQYTAYPTPMSYLSSACTQTENSPVGAGTENNHIIGIQIVATGTGNPLTVSSFALNTGGTSVTSDITFARIWSTGNSDSFAATNQYGNTTTPNGNFTIGGSLNLLPGTNYFWLTYDIAANAAVGHLLDAMCYTISIAGVGRTPNNFDPGGSRVIRNPISGIFTVGSGGDYPNLTSAFNDINNLGVNGNITLKIISDISEPSAAALNQLTEYGAGGYSVLIQPSGAARTITGNSSAAEVIRLDGADRFTIDGRIAGSGNNLTFRSGNNSNPAAVIRLVSYGIGSGCNDITIRNCNIIGASKNSVNVYGIYASDGNSSMSGTAAGADFYNLTISGNSISNANTAMYIHGINGGNSDNITISGNTIGSADQSLSIGSQGINLSYCSNLMVKQNEIVNISGSESIDGIFLETGVTSGTFTQNYIHGLINTSGGRAAGINIGTSAPANMIFANNLIYNVIGNGASGNSNGTYGFYINSGSNYQFYHNTAYLSGDRDEIGTVKPDAISSCLYIESGVTDLNIRNNIFKNSQTAETNNPKSYSFYSNAPNSVFDNINGNNYYSTGSQRMLGYLGGDKSSLSAWSAATGKDGNSVSIDIEFTSDTDLHLNFGSTGDTRLLTNPISEISADFDGETRRENLTNIGADEVHPIMTLNPDINSISDVQCAGNSISFNFDVRLSYVDGKSRSAQTFMPEFQWYKDGIIINGENLSR
ncbi:MAG: C-terminal target protein, partial [Bacteroidota bacterium]|nr:C-terminal target protein [Bacteroidota bacterium]